MFSTQLFTEKALKVCLFIIFLFNFSFINDLKAELFTKTIRGSGGYTTYSEGIIALKDGSCISIGVNTQNIDHKLMLTKLDNKGKVIWQYEYEHEELYGDPINIGKAIVDASDNLYLQVFRQGCDVLVWANIITKFDNNGELLWVKETESDIYNMNISSDSTSLFTLNSNFFGGFSMEIQELDLDGVFIRNIPIPENTIVDVVIEYANDSLIMANYGHDANPNKEDDSELILATIVEDSLVITKRERICCLRNLVMLNEEVPSILTHNNGVNVLEVRKYDMQLNELTAFDIEMLPTLSRKRIGISSENVFIYSFEYEEEAEATLPRLLLLNSDFELIFDVELGCFMNRFSNWNASPKFYSLDNEILMQGNIDNYVMVQTYDFEGNSKDLTTDIQCLQLEIGTEWPDSAYCTISGGSQVTKYVKKLNDMVVWVENVGDEIIETLELRYWHYSLDCALSACGYDVPAVKRYEHLNLFPGMKKPLPIPAPDLDKQLVTDYPRIEIMRPNDKVDCNFDDNSSSEIIVTGVKEQTNSGQNKINIWPNPAQHHIQLQLPTHFTNTPYQYSIFDTKGQQILTANGQQGIDIPEINIANLPKGLYFVKIQNNSIEQTVKFLKQ